MKLNFLTRQQKQRGFTLVEVMIVIAILGSAIAVFFYFGGNIRKGNQANNTAVALNGMVEKARTSFAGQFSAISATTLNQAGIVYKPFQYDSATTSITDPWGNTVTLNGSATSLAMVIGGTLAMTADQCVTIAKTLINTAAKINVGTGVTATAGVISGGSAYFTSPTETQANLTAGCSATAPLIGAQFNP
jgi:prepilin-type N-terminal cleavage/methylation domain-containing protein